MFRFTILLFTILFSINFYGYGQKKFDLSLRMQRTLAQQNAEKTTLDFFVKGDLEKIERLVINLGGVYKYGYKNISSVTIPVSQLDHFFNSDVLLGVEEAELPIVPLVDTSIIHNCVIPVHNGDAPLPRAYKGNGVIVGIIDDGIDIDHPDFVKPNGDSRIKFLWDQNASVTGKPKTQPYNYGTDWNQFEIQNGQCTHVETGSHGSNVAGIAAGNGRADSKYVGMAPNADLIIVKVDNQSLFLSHVVDAADYIFKKAAAMGKPCVINVSYGTYVGSRDGKDEASLLIDALLEEQGGRSLVAAAGNAGGLPYHLGYEVTSDTSFTWFKTSTSITSNKDVYFELWADTADFNDVYFSFSVDSSYNVIVQSEFLNIPKDYGIGLDPINKTIILSRNNNTIATIITRLVLDNARYLLQVQITPLNPAHGHCRLITRGSGKFDIWSSTQLPGCDCSDMVIPNPVPANYKVPDTRKTLVSSFQNSDHVITVGNYVNRYSYPSNCGITITPEIANGESIGEIDNSSSRGPTRDERLKPDISAPGGTSITVRNQSYSTTCEKIAPGGFYMRNGGTSMASPAVAGVVALYLEKYPDATYRQVKEAIIRSAKVDSIMGTVPNNAYGHGRVCAFEALQLKLGCMDVNAVNYDSSANVDDGTCEYVISVPVYGSDDVMVQFHPNIFNGQSKIVYKIKPGMEGKARVVVNNMLGQRLDEIILTHQEGMIPYLFANDQPGLYLYSVTFEGRIYKTGRFITY